MRMLPLWGAGMLITLIVEGAAIEYAQWVKFGKRSGDMNLWRHWTVGQAGGRMFPGKCVHCNAGDQKFSVKL